MKILHYNDFDYGNLKAQVAKVEKQLAADDFKSAEVKKMRNNGYYRAKLDKTNRLLFQLARYNSEPYALLLEVIPNHAYEKSKFLRGAEVKDNHFTEQIQPENLTEDEAPTLRYINPQASRFHLLDKVISLDGDQQEIYNLPAPLIIIGSAGSGKTALTLEKMKTYRGSVAYVSLSDYLVRNSRELYYANGYENDKQEVDFLSFNEYLKGIRIPAGKELDYRTFERWYQRKHHQRFKFDDPYKVFEEFKGVITGSVTKTAYLGRTDYLGLGIKQSIFLAGEREAVYDLFEKYLELVNGEEYYDASILAHGYLKLIEPSYDFLVVDEVQDITNVQLLLLTKALTTPGNFILSGDSNQIVHPNFFSWSKIKTLFFNQDLRGSALRILKTNYRNSRGITKLSNDLLKIKNARFGSIDKESTYLINTVAESEGEINFLKYGERVLRDLNKRTADSAKFAVLVMDRDQKARVSKFFKTPLIFTIQEAKGLEYENIILLNFVSDYDKTFREIAAGVTSADLADDQLRYSRAKDKGNKEQEAYKFYINSLYVAFTRAVKNIYLVESATKNDLLRLLGVVDTKEKVDIQVQKSSNDEWLDEAQRLEQQGKTEQAEAIRARLRGEEFIGVEEAEALAERIFAAPQEAAKKDLERLLKFYAARHQTVGIRRLMNETGYGPAKFYIGEYEKAQKVLLSYVRSNNRKKVEHLMNKYGHNLTTYEEGMTGFMVAAQYCQQDMLYYFLDKGASKGFQDHFGRTALQHLLIGFDRRKVKAADLHVWYPKLAPQVGYCRYDGRQYVLNARSMEFFVANLLSAMRREVYGPEDPVAKQCLMITDFMNLIQDTPKSLLPEYRRKRQYVSSILSKNEVDRDDRYNKHFLLRRGRGCYDLHPGAELVWE
ncbi:hypothetical protein [Neolewinella antarctica]|uniref:DNA helicase n=1 Tax=Neolewinella antarctica TaxID=442734 RepID=A0ABX0XCK6_9BACT|nr:hypothetical protein [Neolewinella antarctica]NJC27011.1 hypothetical protein [Neolewinella antarctica]